MKRYTEQRFEEWIEQSLLKNGYQESFIHSNEDTLRYNRELCLMSDDVISFIKNTQTTSYDKLYSLRGELSNGIILSTIDKSVTKFGIIHTLRNGIRTDGCSFELLYFKPNSNLNQDHLNLYSQNKFSVVRQLHFSKRNSKSLDMVIFLNGIPLLTMELKNKFTSQDITHSENQYRRDRDPKEPLFTFKRCLVHFCVDNDRVSMTTQLKGEKTKFLPYNKNIENPDIQDDYRTSYLWNEILTPDSLLDIIENFVLVSKESDREWDPKRGMVVEEPYDVLIFPRYHQLEVIRKLRESIKSEGVGNNYLIQHTTGSGKSYSIGYLSHTLTSLYQKDGDTKRMFDTIIVLTDRKVLDQQLQNTISKMSRVDGVVNSVDLNSKQLQEFLEKGKDIIITTVQKFPVISDGISQLKSRTFGVIIDEVHSSQSGETSKHIKKSLSKVDSENEDEDVIELEEQITTDIESRGKQSHISFFGFTGTPKNKTIEIFGRKGEDGQFRPFHVYSMKQSIYEGFTLDVLKNYTTYKRYFKVRQKQGIEDVEVPESQVIKELVQFVDSHPETIRKKVSIILQQFVNTSSKTIGGRGRGMVVVRSRYHCVLFQQEMVKQMKEMGLPYSCLVGFSGTIKYGGKENTESSLNIENGFNGRIPDGMKDPRYRILIVSNKFQTGYDEPLLQSMYVDKRLSGVQCVQTLSRLNRTKTGKLETFVLDFVNDTEDIVDSFQPFYESTILTEETDPNILYDLVTEIEQYNLYTKYELDSFCKELYDDNSSVSKMENHINPIVDRYNQRLNDEEKDKYKSLIQSFIRLYSYISQISDFTEVHWEKTYLFLRMLNKKLPKGKFDKVSVYNDISLESLRLQLIGQSKLELEPKIGELSPLYGSEGKVKEDEPYELLSQIIEKLNTVHGIELTEDDRVTLGRVMEIMKGDEELLKVFNGNNTDDVRKDFFEKILVETLVGYHDDRIDFYKKVMDKRVLPVLIQGLFQSYLQTVGR